MMCLSLSLIILAHAKSDFTPFADGKSCLDDREPLDRMRKLDLFGEKQPLRIWRLDWTAGHIVAGIADILIREKMAVETNDTYGSGSTGVAVLGLTGCADPLAVAAKCTADTMLDQPLGHVLFSGWEPYYNSNWKVMPHHLRPNQLGSIGYDGFDGMFIPQSIVDEAYAAAGVNLLDHKGYDQTWNPDVAKFFDTYEDVNTKANGVTATDCATLGDASPDNAKRYRDVSGDVDGVEVVNGLLQFKCPGGWWFSKACRANPLTCIPVITVYTGWGWEKFAQKAHFTNMPIAMSSWGWTEYYALPVQAKVLLFYWYPEASLIKQNPKVIRFPPFNANEWREGKFESEGAKQAVHKLATPALEGADDDVYTFIEEFMVPLASVDDFLAAADVAKQPHFDVACDWVKANRAVWEPWIPDLDRCSLGKGLVVGTKVCKVCEAGEVSTFDNTVGNQVCKPCSAGRYCTMGATHETPCDAGHYCPVGTSRPKSCPIGTSNPAEGAQNISSCNDCGPGTFSATVGGVMCHQCPLGQFVNDMGAAKCNMCMVGTFQHKLGQTACYQCMGDFTSQIMGATSPKQCACPAGKYYSAISDKCFDCGLGIACPGGNGLPLVKTGFYAEPAKSAWTGEYVWVDDISGFEYKSDTPPEEKKGLLFSELTVWECIHGEKACPGSTIKTAEGVKVEGVRNIFECAGSLMQVNGCSRCANGFFYSPDQVECVPCTGGDEALFPTIFICGLIALCAFYRITKLQRSQKLTSALILASSFSIVASFCQLLGIIGFYHVNFPNFLAGLFDFFRLFVLDIDVLKAACALGSDFSARFLSRTLSPVIFLGTFCCLQPVSVIVHHLQPRLAVMNVYKMFNCLGIVLTALYITLCKTSFQFFERATHPNAPPVVAAYPDIDYDSADRSGVLPVAVLATLLYVVGIFGTTMFLCFAAPKMTSKSDKFAISTKFLYMRWNPSRWYWTLVVQLRNLLVALVAVWYPSTVIMQLVMTGAIVGIYTAVQSTMNPWRDQFLSNADSVIGLSIMLLCLFATLLVVQPRDPEMKEFLQSAGLSYLTTVLVLSFLAFSYVVGICLFFLLRPQFHREKHSKFATEVAATMFVVADKIAATQMDDKEYGANIMDCMTMGEQRQLLNINTLLLHEVHDTNYKSGYDSKRLMINKVDSPTVGRGSVELTQLSSSPGSPRLSVKHPAPDQAKVEL